MSRVALITEPALPATCCICSRSANGIVQFIDFNFNLDYYGAVVICTDCIKESLELIEVDKIINLQAELVAKQEELNNVTARLDAYSSVVDSLNSIRPDSPIVVTLPEPVQQVNDESESESDGSDSSGGSEDSSLDADNKSSLFSG